MPGHRVRSAAAFVAGVIVYLATLYRGLSYTQRLSLSGTSYLVFAGLLLFMGSILTVGLKIARYRIASWIIAGVWVGHIVVVKWDWQADPTNHNLLPFEFIILAIVALPAYIGVAVTRLIPRLRRNR
jgi:hypothetical protein